MKDKVINCIVHVVIFVVGIGFGRLVYKAYLSKPGGTQKIERAIDKPFEEGEIVFVKLTGERGSISEVFPTVERVDVRFYRNNYYTEEKFHQNEISRTPILLEK